jgi:hypothetical protein
MANDTPKSTKSGTQQLGAVAGFQTASKVLWTWCDHAHASDEDTTTSPLPQQTGDVQDGALHQVEALHASMVLCTRALHALIPVMVNLANVVQEAAVR